MLKSVVSAIVFGVAFSTPVHALTFSDTLEAWRLGTAMDRVQLAQRFGRSFAALNEGFTAEYFLRCIDDVATYGNANVTRIEDAVRECVAAQMRHPSDADE